MNWSSKLEAVKYDFIQKLVDRHVSFKNNISELTKYYREKDNFSLTDIWAALFITKIVRGERSTTNEQVGLFA